MSAPGKQKSRPSGLAKGFRHTKALLLPMDREDVDGLVLPVRIALERIRQGKADRNATACMAEILLLTGFLTERGFGKLDTPFLEDAKQRLVAGITQGAVSDEWEFDAELVEALVVVVNEYDRMMRETRLQAIVEANEHFARASRSALS